MLVVGGFNNKQKVSRGGIRKKFNGLNGPIYGTCHVTECFGYRYPQCAICGDVDFSHPHEVHLYSEHENCGLGIIY